MSCFSYIEPTSHRLTAISSAVVQHKWYTDWFPAIGVDNIRSVLKNLDLGGNFESRLCLQTALIRTDNPDTVQLLDTQYRGSGEFCQDFNIASYTAGKYFMRLGAAYHLSSGSTPGQADTSLELAYDACGQIIGGRTVQLFTPNTSSYYEPLTDWIPAIHAAKIKAALVVANSSGTFRCQLAVRTAATSREVTDAWSTLFEGTWHSGNGEYNTGELTLSAASKMWVQIGLEHTLLSGSNGGANVSASVSVRRS